MSYNLLVWQWSSEYRDKNRQRRENLTHRVVACEYVAAGDHFAVGVFDQDSFLSEVEKLYTGAAVEKPFVVEQHEKALVFSYGSEHRFEVASKIGQLAMTHGLNGTEC